MEEWYSLSLTDGMHHAEAHSIVVNGSDVYACGFETIGQNSKSVAKLWKNGISTSLTDSTNGAFAQSMCVSGTDVYVAVSEQTAEDSVFGGISEKWHYDPAS